MHFRRRHDRTQAQSITFKYPPFKVAMSLQIAEEPQVFKQVPKTHCDAILVAQFIVIQPRSSVNSKLPHKADF